MNITNAQRQRQLLIQLTLLSMRLQQCGDIFDRCYLIVGIFYLDRAGRRNDIKALACFVEHCPLIAGWLTLGCSLPNCLFGVHSLGNVFKGHQVGK